MKLENVEDVYPLSPLQQGLLFESLAAPAGSGLYVEQFGYRLEGALEVEAFRTAWQRLLDRHAVLRTAFFWDGLDKPLQVVRRQVALPWTFLDWSDRAPEAKAEALAALQRSDRAAGFRPEQAPLMRLTLLRLAPGEHVFLWTHHHLLLDGWCIPILVRELIALYNQAVQGQAAPLPPVRPYRDYIQWLQRQDQDAAARWWRGLLSDIAAPTPLLASLPRTATPEAGHGHVEIALDAGLSAGIEALARRNRLTVNTVFQGAWALLLARVTNEDDVVFGATVSGRPPELRGVEDMVGLFINTLPVRIDIRDEAGETLLPWLARIQAQQREQDAFAHSALAEAQRASGVPGGTPLFETLLVFENFPVSAEALGRGLAGGLSVETLEIVERTNYPLVLAVLPGAAAGRGITLRFYHDAARVDAATVGRLGNLLRTILAGMVADPDRAPLRIPLLEPEARRAVLAAGAAAMPAAPEDPRTLHGWFEAVAAARPEAIALTQVDAEGLRDAHEGAVGYAALNARANRIAHALIARGVGPDERVALCLDPAASLIAAMLGVTKAGGCYVPVDPELPPERQAMILEDAAPRVLVTEARLLARMPAPPGAAVLLLDADAAAIAAMPAENPPPRVRPGDLAYVIYTSGSTGRPKGVLVEHRHAVRLFTGTAARFGFRGDDVWVLFHSFAFDFSVWESWGALLHGGRLVVLPYLLSRAPAEFLRMLRREGVTILNQTPSAFRQLIAADAEDTAGDLPPLALRTVIFGGEALDYTMLAPWFARHPEDAPRLVNGYGITETAVLSTFRPVAAGEAAMTHSLIGEPIPDTALLVLDRHGEPVPPGLPGELYVGGAGVARGYLNRPELTAARFLRDPFDPSGEGRLYRSGDLVRAVLDAEGRPVDLEFLGRADEQVKIRGFRIETGEIATRIQRHPAVADCVVLARKEEATGAHRLAAFVVPAPPAVPARHRIPVLAGAEAAAMPEEEAAPVAFDPDALADALRAALAAELPAYMIPSDIVVLEAIPLTRNGKADRAALLRRAEEGARRAARSAPPATEQEELIAAIWRAALSLPPDRALGRDDDFFELGGHSLLATRVMSRLREVFALDLPIRELFEHPTVARLAARIALARSGGDAGGAAALPPIRPDPSRRHEPFPLTEIQQAYWIGRGSGFELGNVATHGYMEVDCPDLDLPRFERAWQALVLRHDMLRMVIVPETGQQRILPEVPPYRIAVQDLRGRPAAAREAAILATREAMSHQILPAETGPLFAIRATLLDGGVTRLHLGIDALWADAHSLRVLVAELFLLYREPELTLPPLALSFRDYVTAEQEWQRTPAYARSLRYWRERLPDFPPAPDLPLRTSPAALEAPRFARRAGALPPADWAALKRRAAQAGLTPSGVLLAAFADVLAFWSKSPRFAINLTLFNRQPVHPEVDRVIGDFTSLVLLAVDNTPVDRFEARAKRLQRQLWQDLDHRIVNGVTVLRELARLRDGGEGRGALMPVVFTSTLGLSAGGASAPAPLGTVAYSITQTPQVWLDHKVSESGGGALRFEWDAIDALFPEGLLDDMFAAYAALLGRLARDDAAWRESNADRLPPPAQLAARRAANDTAAPVPQGMLHGPWLAMLEERAAEPAVITPDRSLTHGELAALAGHVARRLRQDGGLGRAEPVAVVMEKGWAQVAGVLGVLLAGGAYVPIDPAMPRERMAGLLAQTGARHVLTEARLRDALAWPPGLTLLAVDAEQSVPGAPLPPPPEAQDPGDLAYVIFTSGSTGTPKGVMIDHRGALNTVSDINARFGVGPGDRVLALSALGFDLSVWDIFGVLGAGGALVMPDPERRREPDHWVALMAAHRVTLWNTVPALMQMLADHLQERGLAPPPGLRLVMMSGDWIPLPLPDRIRALWPEARQVSLGGATEASIWSIFHPIDRVDPDWKSIPYGRPLANQGFQVLNAHLAPCPVWVPGQLHISGIGLALGYWGDAEKTAASFFVHPRTGERLYRTGDLGRYLPDGSIEFLGREDNQVKLRGHRIELGEVEAALLRHPLVREAVANIQGERHRGQQRLVAHVVLEDAAATDDDPDAVPDGVLRDAAERTAFRLSGPGLRPDADALEAVPLAAPARDAALAEAFLARRTRRRFERTPVPTEALGHFLSGLMALDLGGAVAKRLYPSAGSLYPVQAYLAVQQGSVQGLAGGLYWYHPLRHALVAVAPGAGIDPAAFGPPGGYNRRVAEEAGFTLLLVSRPAGIRPIYGVEAAERFAALEAGAMLQLLMERAPRHGIGLCPVGNMDASAVAQALRLEPDQAVLHAVLGGPVTAEPAAAWPEEPAERLPVAAEIARFLRDLLPEYMIPAAILPLPALPLTANGKVDRGALRAMAPEPESSTSGGGGAPRDRVEHTLMAIWQALLDHPDPIGREENFFDLGGNSLLAVRLATAVQQRLGRQAMLTDIFRNPTLAQLAALLRGQGARPEGGSAALLTMRGQGTRPPLFCFPGAGGHALYLYHLARHLPADQPVHALQPEAADGEAPPLTRIEDMARHYIPLIRAVQPAGPYHLAGHSLGAKVALEVAVQLRAAGEEVATLAVLDGLPFYEAAQQAGATTPGDELAWLVALVRAAAGFAGETIEGLEPELAPLSPEARLARVTQHLQRAGVLPEGVDPRQVRAMVALFRANTEANAAYRPRPTGAPLPVSLFLPEALDAAERAAAERAWQRVGPVAAQVTPGDHLTMLAEPQVRDLAARLDAALRG